MAPLLHFHLVRDPREGKQRGVMVGRWSVCSPRTLPRPGTSRGVEGSSMAGLSTGPGPSLEGLARNSRDRCAC